MTMAGGQIFNIPGNDVIYTVIISNTGSGTVTTDTVFIVDTLPANATFFDGDFNGPAAGTDAIIFTDNSSGLTWTYASDVGYSAGPAAPTSFGDCSALSGVGYDATIRFLCINPSGVMAGSSGGSDPSFQIEFRARIE